MVLIEGIDKVDTTLRCLIHFVIFVVCYGLSILIFESFHHAVSGMFFGHWMSKCILLQDKYAAEAKRQILVDASIRGEYPEKESTP